MSRLRIYSDVVDLHPDLPDWMLLVSHYNGKANAIYLHTRWNRFPFFVLLHELGHWLMYRLGLNFHSKWEDLGIASRLL